MFPFLWKRTFKAYCSSFFIRREAPIQRRITPLPRSVTTAGIIGVSSPVFGSTANGTGPSSMIVSSVRGASGANGTSLSPIVTVGPPPPPLPPLWPPPPFPPPFSPSSLTSVTINCQSILERAPAYLFTRLLSPGSGVMDGSSVNVRVGSS